MSIPTDSQKHRYALKILESHLDTFGHVNNATYLALFEEARWDLITSNGYGLMRIQETGQAPVVLEINIRFKRELRLRQDVMIETRLLSHERIISTLRQDIVDQAGVVYTSMEVKFGLFDLKERKLLVPTPEWLKAIGG